MKKNMLTVAVAAAMLGFIATGCSSTKQGGSGADSAATSTDSSAMTAPADSAATPATDSASTDTAKTDTTKTP